MKLLNVRAELRKFLAKRLLRGVEFPNFYLFLSLILPKRIASRLFSTSSHLATFGRTVGRRFRSKAFCRDESFFARISPPKIVLFSFRFVGVSVNFSVGLLKLYVEFIRGLVRKRKKLCLKLFSYSVSCFVLFFFKKLLIHFVRYL